MHLVKCDKSAMAWNCIVMQNIKWLTGQSSAVHKWNQLFIRTASKIIKTGTFHLILSVKSVMVN